MYYKSLEKMLSASGYIIVDESHEKEPNQPGRLIPHYFKYVHPKDAAGEYDIELTAKSNKNGTPGKIIKIWQGGKLLNSI